MEESRPYRRDGAGHPIPGGSKISGIFNEYVDGSTWRTVKIPASQFCKALLCKLRSGNRWKARRVGETDYITIEEMLSLDIALEAGENLFQVQTESGSDTFEVLLLD
jgi:hypothetical protein